MIIVHHVRASDLERLTRIFAKPTKKWWQRRIVWVEPAWLTLLKETS